MSNPKNSRRILQGLRALAHNEGWIEVVKPAIDRALKEHLSGAVDVKKTAEQRTEYIRGYHSLNELSELVDKSIAQYAVEVEKNGVADEDDEN